jgi:hypothetical protein
VVAVTALYDALVSGAAGERIGRDDAIVLLREHPATFRNDVLEALSRLVRQRRDAGARRRRRDTADQEAAGAA